MCARGSAKARYSNRGHTAAVTRRGLMHPEFYCTLRVRVSNRCTTSFCCPFFFGFAVIVVSQMFPHCRSMYVTRVQHKCNRGAGTKVLPVDENTKIHTEALVKSPNHHHNNRDCEPGVMAMPLSGKTLGFKFWYVSAPLDRRVLVCQGLP